MTLKLFLSYSKKGGGFNEKIAEALYEKLKGNSNLDVFWDQLLPLGQQWEEILFKKAREANIFVYLASEHSLAPKSFCVRELDVFQKNNSNGLVIPIFLDNSNKGRTYRRLTKYQGIKPIHPETAEFIPVTKWWSDEKIRDNTLSHIFSEIEESIKEQSTKRNDDEIAKKTVERKSITLEKGDQPYIKQVNQQCFNPQLFEELLENYLAFFGVKFTSLTPLEQDWTPLPYYYRPKHIAFVACLFDEQEMKFWVEESLINTYRSVGEEFPWLYLLPAGIWRRDDERALQLKFPKLQILDAINDFENKIKAFDKNEKMHIVSLDLLRSLY